MIRRPFPLAAVAVLAIASPATGQSARDIMDEAVARYTERMEGIEDYTVTQAVMGVESTLHFTRQEIDGHVTFVPDLSHLQAETPEATGEAGGTGPPGQWDNNYFMQDAFIERMRVEGRETVNGHDTHVLVIDDFEGLDLSGLSIGGSGVTPRMMRMYLDTEEYLPRRMDMAGTMAGGEGSAELSTTVLLKDYREVDGMLYPFLVEIDSEGLGEAMGSAMTEGMSPEERSEMEQAMAQMEAELEKLPEAQRAMMRKMMEGQMQSGMAEMMDQAVRSIVVETTELVVNAGPPGGD